MSFPIAPCYCHGIPLGIRRRSAILIRPGRLFLLVDLTAPILTGRIAIWEDSPDLPGTRDGIIRSVEDTPVDLGNAVRDFYQHVSEVRVDRIVRIETAQRRLEADQLIAIEKARDAR
ncbi:hypothetical protein Tco_1185032 [Tanacetum coccineum]